MAQVTVYPPSTTPSGGSIAAYCDPYKVSPTGANATIQFQFPTGNSGWSFVSSNAFQIKPTGNQPPTNMFSITNNSTSTLVVQDKNGDGKLYSYSITIKNGTTTITIDPDIQNDLETTRG